mgnify:CR=1 FL=1
MLSLAIIHQLVLDKSEIMRQKRERDIRGEREKNSQTLSLAITHQLVLDKSEIMREKKEIEI